MFRKTALAAGIGLALSAAAQADYRWEAGADLTGGDVNAIGVGGTFYLDRVDDTRGPLGEAAFIDHASSVSVNYVDGKTDGDGPGIEFKDYGIAGRYVTDEAGWIFDLGYERNEPDNPLDVGPDEFEIDTFTAGVGKYLTDTTTLVFSYQNRDADDGGDVDSYRGDIDHLMITSWGGIKFAGAYGQVDVDDDIGDDIDIYELDVTVYPTNAIGLGAGYRNTENDLQEVEQYFLSAEYFITNDVAVSLEYQDAEIEDTDIDADAIVFGARLRF